MSEVDILASDRWRRLLPDEAVVYETSQIDAAKLSHAEERALVGKAAPSRVQEFAAGRLCAGRALADLGFPPAPLLRTTDRRPTWPQGVNGSITHTHGHCAVAVTLASDCIGIGIDAETAGRVGGALERRICTPAEVARLERLNEAGRRQAATLIFSAKEAFYKAQSHLAGAVRGFHDVEIEIGEGGFLVSPRRNLPRELQALGLIEGRYSMSEDLVLAGVFLRRAD